MSYLKEGTKIGVVGKSGSGKSLYVDIMAYALKCQQCGSGELMRDLFFEKFGTRDLEKMSGKMDIEMDRTVDKRAIEILTNRTWTGLIHGRVIRLLTEGLIKHKMLDSGNYLNVVIDCHPTIRAQWGLAKFRKQQDNPYATIEEAQESQRVRDLNDFQRLRTLYRDSHGLERPGHLYQAQDTVTRGININAELMPPKQELLYTLGVLYHMGKVSVVGYNIALLRGLYQCIKKGF